MREITQASAGLSLNAVCRHLVRNPQRAWMFLVESEKQQQFSTHFAGSDWIEDDRTDEQDSEQTGKLQSPNEFDDALAPSLTQMMKQSCEL